MPDILEPWIASCVRANDLQEADRAVTALERRLGHLVIDESFVVRKLVRAQKALPEGTPTKDSAVLRGRLQEAMRLVSSGEPLAANRLLTESLAETTIR